MINLTHFFSSRSPNHFPCRQFTGINAVFFNTSSIFASVGVQNSDDAALLVMGPQVLVSVATCFLMDSAGRRPMLVRPAILARGMHRMI